MFTKYALEKYAESLPEKEKKEFLDALAGMKEETRGNFKVILEEEFERSNLGGHLEKIRKEFSYYLPVDILLNRVPTDAVQNMEMIH